MFNYRLDGRHLRRPTASHRLMYTRKADPSPECQLLSNVTAPMSKLRLNFIKKDSRSSTRLASPTFCSKISLSCANHILLKCLIGYVFACFPHVCRRNGKLLVQCSHHRSPTVQLVIRRLGSKQLHMHALQNFAWVGIPIRILKLNVVVES